MSVYNDPRRLKSGWYNLGRVMIPVLPLPVVLTDRADGTQWLITFDTSQGPDSAGRIAITSDMSAGNREGLHIFAAFEEPYLIGGFSNVQYRLFLRSQRLGVETLGFDQSLSTFEDAPTYAVQTGSTDRRQLLVAQDTLLSGPTLGFTVDQDQE